MQPSKITPSPIEPLNSTIFKPLNLIISELKAEPESKEYFAHTFKLGNKKVIFRNAKITPTKVGLFVSIWKRNGQGITCPYDIADSFDLFLITAKNQNQFGVFIFSKKILLENGILSNQNMGGKRGFRVYPSWDLTSNRQAQTSQAWQKKCFIELSENDNADIEKVYSLLK